MENFLLNVCLISSLIFFWLAAGYLPGGIFSAVLCSFFWEKKFVMPRFRCWEWGVPFAAMAVNLTFLLVGRGLFEGKSLSNISEGIIAGWCWSVFFVLRIVFPRRRSTAAAAVAAGLTLLAAVSVGLFMPCLPE